MYRYCRAGQAADDNITQRMLIACWIFETTNTTSDRKILIVFHCNISYTKAPQYYVTCALSVCPSGNNTFPANSVFYKQPLSMRFSDKYFVRSSLLCHTRYMFRLSTFPWFDLPNISNRGNYRVTGCKFSYYFSLSIDECCDDIVDAGPDMSVLNLHYSLLEMICSYAT